MNRFTYTGSFIAVVLGYSGTAFGQEGCQQQVEQLQSRMQQSGLATQTQQELEERLGDAQRAGASECENIVAEVRGAIESAQIDPERPDDASAPDTHLVEAETLAQTGPREQTEAEIEIEEPIDDRGALPSQRPGQEAGQQPAQGSAITDTQAAELVGENVQSSDGEDIGEISAVARSLEDDQLHALVDVGGFLGVGERTVSIPLDRVRLDQQGRVTTQMPRDEIESMEEVDPAQYASGDDDRSLR